uniref:Testis-expressed 10 n=1 Tax=Xenopus tropicalis TaxID=8364 RepID=A0A803JRQ2_XENTR
MSSKRKRQEDFQKVKLKVGRKKPRADQITDTTFKSKFIHLSKQLKEDQSSPTNERKLNITDLLSQMHHYNAGVKHSALVGLKELLSTYPSIIESHISSIISEVAAVFTDKDSAVRVAAVSLLQYLVPIIPPEKIAPFFPLVSAHLSSAMTHIIMGIQQDSLRILDILLEEYPELLIDRSNMLLHNFLELISHQKTSKEFKSANQKSSWTLAVSVDQKIISQNWRLNVLIRLKKFLHAFARQASKSIPDDEFTETSNKSLPKRKSQDLTWIKQTSCKQFINLYEHCGSQHTIDSSFQLRSFVMTTAKSDECTFSTRNLKAFTETIIPLLIECWIEESPSTVIEDISKHFLCPSSHHLLQQVLSIISLLWKLCELQDGPQKLDGWLRRTYLADFKHHFMRQFPYSVHENAKQKKNKKKSNRDSIYLQNGLDHLLLNLTLCDIMIPLASSPTLPEDSEWLAVIRMFVSEKLNQGYQLNCKQLKRLLDVTNKLLNIQRNRVATEKLIHSVYVLYQQRELQLSVRSMLLKFLKKVYLKEEEVCHKLGRSRSNILSRWISGLPQQLANLGSRSPQLSAIIIDTIYTAATRSHIELLQSLQTTACQIYGFSAERLSWMQGTKHTTRVSKTQVSPLCLYLTDQQQFAHHWMITKAACCSLSSVSARSQCFDILQNAIIKHLGELTVLPDSTAGSILYAINTLFDQSCVPSERLYTFLPSCCYSIFSFLLTVGKDFEHLPKRDPLWAACISLLSLLPNVLKFMLKNLQVSRACQEELPVIAQLLRLLLQNPQLRSHMMTNAFLVQQTLQDVMNLKCCEIQEQWLTDLQYCFNAYLPKQPLESPSFSAVY